MVQCCSCPCRLVGPFVVGSQSQLWRAGDRASVDLSPDHCTSWRGAVWCADTDTDTNAVRWSWFAHAWGAFLLSWIVMTRASKAHVVSGTALVGQETWHLSVRRGHLLPDLHAFKFQDPELRPIQQPWTQRRLARSRTHVHSPCTSLHSATRLEVGRSWCGVTVFKCSSQQDQSRKEA